MSYQVLARKWRPKNFAEMVGQDHVVRALKNALDADRMHHAFLFTGTRGVGKTTVARILAKCLNCEKGVTSTPCGSCSSCTEIDEGRFVDLLEVDAASRSKVDETRELMDNVQFAPTRGRYKVYLIDEVHMFSDKSFNALLKTLEEPPPHVKFLLATTDPQKLPITVLSRCLQFNLKRLPLEQIAGYLGAILKDEGVEAEEEGVLLISAAADGSMRDALSLLDQAIAFGGGRLQAFEVRAMLGAFDSGQVQGLLEALADGDAKAVMAAVDALASEATDFAEALSAVLSFLQKAALVQVVPGALDGRPEAEAVTALANRMSPEDVQLFYQIGLIGRRDLPLAPDPRGGFEMALLRMLAFQPAAAAAGGAVPESSTEKLVAESGARTRGAVRRAAPVKTEPEGALDPASVSTADWTALVESLELNGLARELAVNCALRQATPEQVRLALAPEHAQLLRPGVQDKLKSALHGVLRGQPAVVIEVDTPDNDTPATVRKRAEENRRAKAVKAIQSDAFVQDLCKTFGAKVDPELVQPVPGSKGSDAGG
ncbi:MAG: DNA polymerase III subunit gamma/tau [Gammaproteobacteria bacterium]|nr:DNA polymerase III subunit gamma/tau [Gammaproteobacteria bacterium]MDH3412646.1 DNA polymerase III subunit gamma/tau [Gammaproteobacteria bacterium]